MPSYTDNDGRRATIQDYPGQSYRAAVINRALRTSEFLWATARGRTFPLFSCSHCQNLVTFAGVQGDHIVARAHGGGDELSNLQILCSTCNAADMHHRGASVADRTRGALARRGERYWVQDQYA